MVALGIGATTAVFSVVRGVLLQPLPYREPNRLVLFRADLPGYVHQPALTAEEYVALRERTDLFDAVAIINPSEGSLTTPDQMEAVTAASASDNFLDALGVTPALGRAVSHRDAGTEWITAVDISYELWQRHWHGDLEIVGKRTEVNNIPVTIAGVLPRGFRLYLGPGVDVPPQIDAWYPRAAGYDRDPFRGQIVIARLNRGLGLAAAQAAVDAMTKTLVASRPASYRTGAVRLSLSTLDQDVVSEVRPALIALAVAVAFVLLVACANLTNLLLARATARSRELAVRVSIGASRGQIVRQLLAEGLVVGGLGAGAGLILAQWCVAALLGLAPATLPRREAIAVDTTMAGVAIAVSMICTLLVSLIPAWHATKSDVAGMLKQDPASSRRAATMRGLLIASQLALSLALLVGAGLMMRAFVNMRAVPLGFDPHRAVAINVPLQVQRFNAGDLDESRAKRLAFYHELADSVRRLPGVDEVGIGLPVPLGGASIPQRFSAGPGEPEHPAAGLLALGSYLNVLRVPLVDGRYFTVDDDNRPVVIVDQRLAELLGSPRAVVGRRLLLAGLRPQSAEIIGVVRHVQTEGLREAGLPQIWMMYATKSYSSLNVIVRAANPMALVPAVEAAVQRLGPGRPVHDVRLLDDYVADASADTRFALFVLAAFAALAVILTAVGVYGVAAYATARRAREIALRLALGADRARIVSLVVREGLVWTIVGLAVGAVAARGLTRYLQSLLFHVTAGDALTFIIVAAVLGLVALAATALPAIRAVRVDPMLALRSE